MKFNIPVIIRPLALKDYAPEMEAVIFQVWVNPPRAVLSKYWQAQTDLAHDIKEKNVDNVDSIISAVQEFAVEVWSKGDEDSRWTIEEVIQLWEHCQETDPALWAWLIGNTINMIQDHRNDVKKK